MSVRSPIGRLPPLMCQERLTVTMIRVDTTDFQSVEVQLQPKFATERLIKSRQKEKGEGVTLPQFTFNQFHPFYAGAGLPPVIGGKIGFSGFAVGSFN